MQIDDTTLYLFLSVTENVFLVNVFSSNICESNVHTYRYPHYRVVPELEILTILPDLTLNFVTLIGQPQCNGRYCWQASLFHLPPKFTRTVKKCGNKIY